MIITDSCSCCNGILVSSTSIVNAWLWWVLSDICWGCVWSMHRLNHPCRQHMCSYACCTTKLVAAICPINWRQEFVTINGLDVATEMRFVNVWNLCIGSDTLASVETRSAPMNSSYCSGIRVDFYSFICNSRLEKDWWSSAYCVMPLITCGFSVGSHWDMRILLSLACISAPPWLQGF